MFTDVLFFGFDLIRMVVGLDFDRGMGNSFSLSGGEELTGFSWDLN